MSEEKLWTSLQIEAKEIAEVKPVSVL